MLEAAPDSLAPKRSQVLRDTFRRHDFGDNSQNQDCGSELRPLNVSIMRGENHVSDELERLVNRSSENRRIERSHDESLLEEGARDDDDTNVVRSKSCSGVLGEVALGFWFLGLLNNSTFVIMNAGAKQIFAEGVGGVYLANVLPSLFVKASAPFWFHMVSYNIRVVICAILTVACLTTVAMGHSLGLQLFGVAVGAFAGSLGEASFLAYSSYFDGPTSITAWSSGTGFAGVFGYFWVVFLTKGLGFGFRLSLILANVLPVAFLFVFFRILLPARTRQHVRLEPCSESEEETSSLHDHLPRRELTGPQHEWSARERIEIFISLWQYTIPLFLVYFAEYVMQSGTWAAIGFPIEDKSARDDFYVYANWMYQVGVFASRSSGTLITLRRPQLWIMPLAQVILLAFFTANGIYHLWWNYGLLSLAFVVGLFGGTVYVHGYILISKEVQEDRREFALGSASVADTFGIILANVGGIIVQGCLYAANNITDDGRPPAFTCGKDYSS
mmetsp:Transcript_17251/g.33874  ORF Transcript_17251/g.33874 Transcript_17251/m.33874 type:complete len:501 (+) Transcript_17251:58-1560(+)